MRKKELLEENEELQEEIRKLRDGLADANERAYHAQHEWQHEMVENDRLRSINLDLLKNYEKLDGAVDKLSAYVSILVDKCEDSSKGAVDYERGIDAREEEIEALHDKISYLEYERDTLEEYAERRNKRIAELEAAVEKANKLLLKCMSNPSEQK